MNLFIFLWKLYLHNFDLPMSWKKYVENKRMNEKRKRVSILFFPCFMVTDSLFNLNCEDLCLSLKKEQWNTINS